MKAIRCLLLPALLAAGTVSQVVEFSPAELSFSRYQGFDVVELPRGHVAPDPGRPCLPRVEVTLAIPARAQVTAVSAEPLATVELPGDYDIVPSQPGRPISRPAGAGLAEDDRRFASVPPDPAVYSSPAPFPPRVLLSHHTGSAAGFRLVSVVISPFEYSPAQKKLRLHTRVRATVEYQDDAVDAPVLRPVQRDRALTGLRALVANPGDLSHFSPTVAETDLPAVDYLVITSDRLLQAFEPFLAYKTGRGLRTEVRTAEWIDRNCPGRDLQEKMRNLIRDYFQNRGLSYVLLAGDNLLVPCRRIRVSVSGETGDIPADLYYADLDYSWDSNRNNLFGEMGDSVDLYADVILGRASVDNATEVQTFIRKVRDYEEQPEADYIRRTLLPSGWLWRSQNYHGRIVNDSIANITPAGWPDVKLQNPPSARVVADSFDHGFAFFDPAGHGNANGVYDEDGTPIYTSGYARSQQNARRYSIMTSLACNPGDFEAEDCVAENGHNAPDGGCIAVMMNSRFGWGTPPSFGPSEKLCVRFYDFLLNRSTFELGTCHSRSREAYAGSARTNSLWRWCMTEFNLFGDPSLDIWTDVPTQLSVTSPDTIQTGGQSIQVRVTDQSGPVANSLVCAWKDNETHVAGLANSQGIVNLSVHPVTPGALQLTASAHNRLPAGHSIAVQPGAPEPFICYVRASINDSGQAHENGILEPGETGRLTLVLHNQGLAPASGVNVTLRTSASGLSIPDSTAGFGTIPAQDSGRASDFLLRAAANITPGSSPELVALVRATEGTWELVFRIPVGYPGRVAADVDTGACALTVTARGSIGFDTEGTKQGRGFRFPKTDTSSLNVASLALANSAGYVVDRFYTSTAGQLDRDWHLTDSVHACLPAWSSHQTFVAGFNDAGHPASAGIRVTEYGFGTSDSGFDNFAVLLYDIANQGPAPVDGLYCGILADFDVKASDRFHDLCYTSSGQRTAFLRNVNIQNQVCGVKLLHPDLPAYLACLDHSRYVYPDSGLSEDMKYRILSGSLGAPGSDRPYNWSVSVSTGPFNLAPQAEARLAFAFIAAADSASYLRACENCQQWFDSNLGIAGPETRASLLPAGLLVQPSPSRGQVTISNFGTGRCPVRLRIFDPAGRCIEEVYRGKPDRNGTLRWTPQRLPPGVYIVRLEAGDVVLSKQVTLVR